MGSVEMTRYQQDIDDHDLDVAELRRERTAQRRSLTRKLRNDEPDLYDGEEDEPTHRPADRTSFAKSRSQ